MKEQPLKQKSLELLKHLVEHFLQTKVDLDNPETLLFYGKVRSKLDIPNDQGTHGRSLDKYAMDELACWLRDNGLPAITGIIVNDEHPHMPSPGFFDLYKKQIKEFIERKKQPENYQASKFEWLEEEIRKACELDWKEKLAEYGISLD